MSKHAQSGHTPTTLPRDDLEDNPAIGSSRGTTMAGEDPHILTEDGENTKKATSGTTPTPPGRPPPSSAIAPTSSRIR